MSLWSRIRAWFGSESAQTRPTGGVSDPDAPDTHSTTGTTPNSTYVGMTSGDDPGDVEGPATQREAHRSRAEDGPPDDSTEGARPSGRRPEAKHRPRDDGSSSDDA